MPNSSSPLQFADAVVAAPGTAVVPSSAIPDNCTQIVIYNRGANAALYGIAAPGVGTLAEGTNAARIPTNAALTLVIGGLADRGTMNQATVAGSGLVYDAVGGATTLDITYVCALGSA